VFKLLYFLIITASVSGFIALLFFILKSFKKTISLQEGGVLLGNLNVSDEKREAKSLYDRAVAAAQAGKYEEGIRLLALGSLLLLEEKEVLAYQDCYTNGEYLSLLFQRKNLHELFQMPLNLFDRTVYGFESPTMKEFDVFRGMFERLMKM